MDPAIASSQESAYLKLFFYKDQAVVILINLLTGHYFLPSLEIKPEKTLIKKALKKYYQISVEQFDLLHLKDHYFVFIGEWEGTLSYHDDAYRMKWIKLEELPDRSVKKLRTFYRDIVDKNGETIGIASLEEAKKYDLRYKILVYQGKTYDFYLGEDLKAIEKRLKLPEKTISPVFDEEQNRLVYYYS